HKKINAVMLQICYDLSQLVQAITPDDLILV
ncbi:MAG: hypothetical protein ACI9RP_002102, partial [Cyclobacteriaceae bacterium]